MELYEKVFGKYITENSKKVGNNIMINCLWHKDDTPSLGISTDSNNQTYHCFGCSKSGSLIGAYMELNGVDYKTALKQLDMFDNDYKPKPTPPKFVTTHPEQLVPKAKKQHIEVDYSDYCYRVWSSTIASETEYQRYGKRLYELRGITYDTAIACMIGYDESKGWIFSFNRFPDHKCTGYEIRHKEFKKFDFNNSKCYKAKDSESCLSIVYEGWDNKKAICCEGAMDSMFMYQYLHERKQLKENNEYVKVDETIITPTNGVQTVPNLVKQNDLWEKFDEVLFVMDNDAPGRQITEELKQMANENNYNFKFFTGMPDGYDFEDYYKNVLKKELYK